jgi:hypothetical protein
MRVAPPPEVTPARACCKTAYGLAMLFAKPLVAFSASFSFSAWNRF